MTLEELQKIKDEYYPRIQIREIVDGQVYVNDVDTSVEREVLVCGGAGCHAMGGEKIAEAFKKAIEAAGVADKVNVILTGCVGLCSKGPNVVVYPDNVGYVHVRMDDIEKIVKSHFVEGKIPTDLIYDEEVEVRNRNGAAGGHRRGYDLQHPRTRRCGIPGRKKVADHGECKCRSEIHRM